MIETGGIGLVSNQALAYTMAGLTTGCIYTLVSVGFNLIYRVVRVLDLSYSAVLMVGTFVAWSLNQAVAGLGLPTAATVTLVCAGTLAACVVVELILEYLMIRPLLDRGASLLVVIVATLGAFYVLQEIVDHWQGPLPVSFAVPFHQQVLYKSASGTVDTFQIITFVLTGLVLVGVDVWIRRSRAGKSLEAVAQDRAAASLVGIDLHVTIRIAYAVVGLVAGVGALAYLVTYNSTSFQIGLPLGVVGLSAAVVGGMGNHRGGALGGFLLGMIGSYASAFVGATWQAGIAYAILIVLVLYRPEGLFREKSIEVRA